MFETEFEKLSNGEQNEFARVTNTLLLKSFIVRDVFDNKEKAMRINPDYRFIERHFDLINDYLKYTNWMMEKDVLNGVVALINLNEQNRLRMERETSLILFVLRLIYETEKNESSQTGEAIYITTPTLLKTMIDHNITMSGKRMSGRLFAKSLRFLANHNIIAKVSGSYDEGNVAFYILPSILFAVDNQKIKAMSEALEQLKVGEPDEISQEN
ncbi:MAG: DUF4194 domain-containing protein [Erysipelotrichaceae bacterium]|nr:DUF4194 domain-containing protein [Erysipelotrichaceae bacterium]